MRLSDEHMMIMSSKYGVGFESAWGSASYSKKKRYEKRMRAVWGF